MTTPTFSAVLLAGGKSTRMGQDKALLTLPGSTQPLWQRQWNILQNLQPEKIYWSGPPRPDLPADLHILADTKPNAGPLAGISASLNILTSDLLIVLAIDLPQMTSPFLQNLLSQCTSTCGIVTRHENFFEPLAAIYPLQLRCLASDHLAQSRHTMQNFIRAAIQQNLLQSVSLKEEEIPLFKNLNRPSDTVNAFPRP